MNINKRFHFFSTAIFLLQSFLNFGCTGPTSAPEENFSVQMQISDKIFKKWERSLSSPVAIDKYFINITGEGMTPVYKSVNSVAIKEPIDFSLDSGKNRLVSILAFANYDGTDFVTPGQFGLISGSSAFFDLTINQIKNITIDLDKATISNLTVYPFIAKFVNSSGTAIVDGRISFRRRDNGFMMENVGQTNNNGEAYLRLIRFPWPVDILVNGEVFAEGLDFTQETLSSNHYLINTLPTAPISPSSSLQIAVGIFAKNSASIATYSLSGFATSIQNRVNPFTQGSIRDLDSHVNLTSTIIYHGNNHSGGTVPTDANRYARGASITVLGNIGTLIRSGYVFSGWNTAADGSGTNYSAASNLTMGNANIVLYAKWTALRSITYHGNGHSGGSVPVDGQSYQSGASVTVLNNSGTLIRTGYVFSGWNSAADGNGTDYAAASTLTMGGANIVLYAKWTLIRSITYHGNNHSGGSVPIDSEVYQSGDNVAVLGNSGSLVRNGYVFSGWNTAADGSGNFYVAGSTLVFSENINLYASWNAIFHVSTTGSDSTGDGSAGNPYQSLETAINMAKNAEGPGRYPIRVAGGIYNITSTYAPTSTGKAISLYGGHNNNFTIRDSSANETILRDTRTGYSTILNYSISSNPTDELIEIDGFTFHSGALQASPVDTSYRAIYIYGGKLVNITNNKFVFDYAYKVSSDWWWGAINPIDLNPNTSDTHQIHTVANNTFILKNSGDSVYNMRGITTPNYYTNTNLKFRIHNNVFYMPDSVTNESNAIQMMLTTSGNEVEIRNNTFLFQGVAGDNEYDAAIYFGNFVSIMKVENNIFYTLNGEGVMLGVYAGDFASSKNNNFYFNGTSGQFYINTLWGGNTSDISAFNSKTNSGGNTELNPNFINATSDWRLSNDTSISITAGGLDGGALSWPFVIDKNSLTRTGNGSTGWSMGAFEKD